MHNELAAARTPHCPVCDANIGLEDLSTLLSEEKLVRLYEAYPLNFAAISPGARACGTCAGSLSVDPKLASGATVDQLVTRLLFKTEGIQPLSKTEVQACLEGKDDVPLIIYNRVAGRFLTYSALSAFCVRVIPISFL